MVEHLTSLNNNWLTLIYRNESFTFPAGAETGNLTIEVLDHKTFGKDKLLADGVIDVRCFMLHDFF